MNKQVEVTKIVVHDDKPDSIHSSKSNITLEKKFAVGGSDGIKRLVLLTLLGKEQNRRLWFFTKEYKIEEEVELKKIVRTYAVFKGFKLPVPSTIRYYFDKSRKKFYLLMTDISKGGKNRIWGYSDEMSKSQIAELQAMNLSESDLVTITQLAQGIVQIADKNKAVIFSHYYHIVQDKKTKRVALELLDVSPDWGGIFSSEGTNADEMGRFLYNLRKHYR